MNYNFYHMTSIYNLDSILNLGVFSHNDAHNRNLLRRDISNPEVQDLRARKTSIRLHDYACCYFSPRNPMLYTKKDIQSEIVILGIDKKLLEEEDSLFSDGNAASSETEFFRDTAKLKDLPWDTINTRYWNDVEDGKRIKCAEALIYGKIAKENIKKIFCYNKSQEDLIQNKFSPIIETCSNSDLFFK